MINFLFGFSLSLNIIFVVIIYFIYKKLNSKITKKDVENFIVNNFLEDEVVDLDV